MSTSVHLSLGSDVGHREQNLRTAIAKLRELGEVLAVSSFYETEPVEFTESDGPELRRRRAHQTHAATVPAKIQHIEQQMGRRRIQPKGPRNIDLDILLFGDSIISTPELEVPRIRRCNSADLYSSHLPKSRRTRDIRCSRKLCASYCKPCRPTTDR